MAGLFSKMVRPEPKKNEKNEKLEPKTHSLLSTGTEYIDPRPDLESDSELWVQLIAAADQVNPRLAKNLQDMRNWGTRVKETPKGFVLRADTGELLWPDQGTYEIWRDRLLKPYTKQIGELLKSLFLWSPPSSDQSCAT